MTDTNNNLEEKDTIRSSEQIASETVPQIEEFRAIIVEQKDIRGGFQVVTTAPSHPEIEGKFLLYKDTSSGIYRLYAKVNQGWRLIGSTEFLTTLSLDGLSDVVITSVAQGDVFYYNGTNWVNLGAGTSGQFLKTLGPGANPTWADIPASTIIGSFTAYEAVTLGNALCLIAPDVLDQSYSESNQDADQAIGDAAARTYVAQGFQPGAGTYINKLELYLKKTGSPSGDLTVHIYTNSGGAPGNSLGSGTITGSSITTSYAYYTVNFVNPILLQASTDYHIVVTRTAAVNATDYFILGKDTSSPTYHPSASATYAIREGDATPAWTLIGSDIVGDDDYHDAIFKTYKEDTTVAAQVRKTKATSELRTRNFIGFANSSVAAAATVQVNRLPSQTGLTSISPGRSYYLSDTAGAIALTPGSFPFQVAVGKTTTSVENTPPNAAGVPGWVELGSLTWSASSATQTLALGVTYDLVMMIFYYEGAATMNLRLNAISAGNYDYRYFDSGTAIAEASAQTSFELGVQGGSIHAFGQWIISGKHVNGVKSIASAGGSIGTRDANALIDGDLSGDSANLSTISVIPSTTITGKARFYGLII